DLHHVATLAAAPLLRRRDEQPSEPLALTGRVHRKHAEVAALPAPLDVHAGDETVGFREKERPGFQQARDLGQARAVALHEEALDEERAVTRLAMASASEAVASRTWTVGMK